jgi:hypothetical protein
MSIGGFFVRRFADAAVPGSGVAIGILQRLKPLLPYILGLIAIVALAILLWRAPWAEGRQRAADAAKYQPAMDRAAARMVKAEAALRDADEAIKRQNASIKTHADAERRALAEASRLRAEADKRDVGRKKQIASLQVAAARPIPGPPCESIAEVKDAWK